MDADFWLDRWQSNQIGFHESEPNGLLVRNLQHLGLSAGDRIFVPLCGKTLDIGWLLAQGFRVCGVELSRTAIEQLFAGLGLAPEIEDRGELVRFGSEGLDVFVGDFFALAEATLGPVDAVYDRAALIALPDEMRRRYAAHLQSITRSAPQLVICLQYDQELMTGPPFSVREKDVAALYGEHYRISRLMETEVPGGLKGRCPATEAAYLLQQAHEQDSNSAGTLPMR